MTCTKVRIPLIFCASDAPAGPTFRAIYTILESDLNDIAVRRNGEDVKALYFSPSHARRQLAIRRLLEKYRCCSRHLYACYVLAEHTLAETPNIMKASFISDVGSFHLSGSNRLGSLKPAGSSWLMYACVIETVPRDRENFVPTKHRSLCEGNSWQGVDC